MIRLWGIIIASIVQLLLCGCTPGVDNDVKEFVEKTKKQKNEEADGLPKFLTPRSFKYGAKALRSPFDPFVVATSDKPAARADGGPNLNRPKEALESFPLDSLHMVGTLEKEGNFFALLKDSNDNIHLVRVGNYIGQNSGKVEKISEKQIDVREWLTDGKGGWKEHVATLPLAATR